MLIGLCGGLCAGKHEVANFLVQEHNFQVLTLKTPALELTRTQASQNDDDDDDDNAFISRDGIVSSTVFDENGRGAICFFSAEDLLDYVTKRWRDRFVTTDIREETVLELLLQRPFFILVSVDAPVSVRWKRYKDRCESLSLEAPSLEEFVRKSDAHMYHHTHGLASLVQRATIKLLNSSASISTLYSKLQQLDLVDEARLRPTWDAYFMRLASLAAQRSNCMKRRVGCVIVQEKRVISTGYNGAPRGLLNCNEGGCKRCNHGDGTGLSLSMCLCLHAEENALLEAGRERIRDGSILYCDTCPCLTCSIKIVQVGISEVVYSQGYSMDKETARVLSEGGVKLRQFHPPREGLVNLCD
ncbi:cytidine deaminase-like protein [Kalaharituber pfeilii]|nr:cytidine deaminase-like protein [Kalaharituber pfeilii]